MCSWYATSSNDERRGRGKSKQRTHHYFWDLDDGRPGFVRQTKRDRLKLFVDSDGDGLFTKKDELVGSTRIKKSYRGLGLGELIEVDTYGSITAFNVLDPSSTAGHAELTADAGLTFGHPDGGVTAVFKQVVLPSDYL